STLKNRRSTRTSRTVLLPGYGLMREVGAGQRDRLLGGRLSHGKRDGLEGCQAMNTRQVSGGWSSATRAGRAGNQQLTSAAPGRRKNTPMRGAENLALVLVLLAC